MLDVICVLRSGGVYDGEWVRKLKDGVARNLTIKHRFRCLSDVDVPDREPLKHDWPGWWSKIELFAPGVITRRTLYLDLDTVITGSLDAVMDIRPDFAMLRNFWTHDMVGSGVMWFSGTDVPHKVYEKFVRQPQAYMEHHKRHEEPPYIGDQAFIWDAIAEDIPKINDHFEGIKSYKLHSMRRLAPDAKIVCFHGLPRPNEVKHDWMEEHWR